MGYLSERVNYLRGFADGLKIDKETDEGKLLNLIIDVIDDIAISVEDNEDTQNELLDSMDDVDERLSDIEDYLDEEDSCDCDDCDCDDCDCDDETEYGELECPNCGAVIEIDEAVIDNDKNVLICPACNSEIEFEWADDCDCDDEKCCCHDHHCDEDSDEDEEDENAGVSD